VGFAAVFGALGEYLSTAGGGDLAGGTLACIYAAVWIGGITATGSVVAWGKLSQVLGSDPLALPGRDFLNLGMLAACAGGLGAFLDPSLLASFGDPETVRLAALGLVSVTSGLLGLHLTASIGGADMPVSLLPTGLLLAAAATLSCL